jgi:hypothetical protein
VSVIAAGVFTAMAFAADGGAIASAGAGDPSLASQNAISTWLAAGAEVGVVSLFDDRWKVRVGGGYQVGMYTGKATRFRRRNDILLNAGIYYLVRGSSKIRHDLGGGLTFVHSRNADREVEDGSELAPPRTRIGLFAEYVPSVPISDRVRLFGGLRVATGKYLNLYFEGSLRFGAELQF